MSWEDFIRQRVFGPLGMTSSHTSTPDMLADLGDPTPELNIFMPVERSADSIFLGDWKNASCGPLYAPAGGILTTSNDIAKWMTLLIQDGQLQGVRLLSEKAIWEMRSPQVAYGAEFIPYHNPLLTTADYGLGWVSFEYEGRSMYEHVGGWMASVISLIPEEGLAVGVFCNGNFESGFGSIGLVSALKMKVFERLLGAPDLDWSQVFLSQRD